jgi:hypothetical protein
MVLQELAVLVELLGHLELEVQRVQQVLKGLLVLERRVLMELLVRLELLEQPGCKELAVLVLLE